MKLYLQRHCEPVPGPPMDGTRKLTKEGQRQAKEMAAFMVRQVGRVDMVICSPFARATQTSDVMADALGAHIATTRLAEQDAQPKEMWADIERLAAAAKEVLVVGHDPSINALMAWLMGFRGLTIFDPPVEPVNDFPGIRFKHGAIAHLKTKGKTWELHWMANVGMVERDEEQEVAEAALAMLG